MALTIGPVEEVLYLPPSSWQADGDAIHLGNRLDIATDLFRRDEMKNWR